MSADRFVVSDDYGWTQFTSLSDALEYAEVALARGGDEDVTMYEQIDWRTLRPPDLRPSEPEANH